MDFCFAKEHILAEELNKEPTLPQAPLMEYFKMADHGGRFEGKRLFCWPQNDKVVEITETNLSSLDKQFGTTNIIPYACQVTIMLR